MHCTLSGLEKVLSDHPGQVASNFSLSLARWARDQAPGGGVALVEEMGGDARGLA